MVTSIFAAGMKLGDKQGLRFAESIKFAEALECEFDIMVRVERMSYEDAEEYLNFMWDFNICEKEEIITHPNCRATPCPPVDDFIVGTVRNLCGSTAIYSNEKLPRELYDKEVEIRLKEIIPPAPMKTEYLGLRNVEAGCWSGLGAIPFVNVRYNEDIHSLIFEGLTPFIGKKVKITIEEVE